MFWSVEMINFLPIPLTMVKSINFLYLKSWKTPCIWKINLSNKQSGLTKKSMSCVLENLEVKFVKHQKGFVFICLCVCLFVLQTKILKQKEEKFFFVCVCFVYN